MSFRKPCHMPFRKLIPPFTLTDLIKDGKLKPFKKVSRDLRVLRKAKQCQSIVITLREKIALS